MTQINDLQKLIDDRASIKLNKDITNIFDKIKESYGLIHLIGSPLELLVKIKYSNKEESFYSAFHKSKGEGTLWDVIYNTYIEKYKEEENKLFLKEIEELKKKVDNIQQETNNILDNLPY